MEIQLAKTFLIITKGVYIESLLEDNYNLDNKVKDKLRLFLVGDMSVANDKKHEHKLQERLQAGYDINKEKQVLKNEYIKLLTEECLFAHLIINAMEGYLAGTEDLIEIIQSTAQNVEMQGVNDEEIMKTITVQLENSKVILKAKEHQARYIGEMFEAWTIRSQKLRKNDIFDMFYVGVMGKKEYDKSLPVLIDQSVYALTFDEALMRFIEKENKEN